MSERLMLIAGVFLFLSVATGGLGLYLRPKPVHVPQPQLWTLTRDGIPLAWARSPHDVESMARHFVAPPEHLAMVQAGTVVDGEALILTMQYADNPAATFRIEPSEYR